MIDQDQVGEEESERLKERAIPSESPKKRKNQRDEQNKSIAKTFRKNDMRGYITCKRWKEQDEIEERERAADPKVESLTEPEPIKSSMAAGEEAPGGTKSKLETEQEQQEMA